MRACLICCRLTRLLAATLLFSSLSVLAEEPLSIEDLTTTENPVLSADPVLATEPLVTTESLTTESLTTESLTTESLIAETAVAEVSSTAEPLLPESHEPARDFPLPKDIAVKPDAESLGNRSHPTAFIVSNSSTRYSEDAEHPGRRNQCAHAAESPYHKAIAITRFTRTEVDSSKAGGLHQVEEGLPSLLSQQLQTRHAILTPVQLSQGLAAPGDANGLRVTNQVQQLARTHRTQFVVTGEILDMSMAHPGATYAPGLYTRFVNGVHDTFGFKTRFDKRDRHFSFHLNLRDGFTGQVLFQKRYDTVGIWGISSRRDVDFGSALFWESDYGEQVSGLVSKAGAELAAAIQCQPYITRVESRPSQQQILLHSGANNGLRAGDTLALYQLVVQPINGEYQLYDTRLVDRQTRIELREVYPSHSVAVISSDYLLNGQYLAVAP